MAHRYITFFYSGVFAAYLLLVFFAAQTDAHWTGDFTAYYTGGLLAGSSSLYDLEAQEKIQRETLAAAGHAGGPQFLPFINPPHAALPFACLARLASRQRAFVVWLLVQLALTVYVARLLWSVAAERTNWERLFIISLTLALPAVLYTYLNGQLSLALLACLLRHYLSLREGREAKGGLWLALATVKPQLTVLPAAGLFGSRRLVALASFAACVVLLVVVSSLLLGWHRWVEYPALLARVGAAFGGKYGADPRAMSNLKGLLSRTLGGGSAQVINALTYAFFLLSIALALLLWRARLSFELSMAFTILLNLFFSPHLNPQDTVLLAAPAVLLYLYLRRRRLAYKPLAALAVLYPPVFWGLFLTGKRFALGDGEVYLMIFVHLILIGWTGYLLLAEYRRPGGQADSVSGVRSQADEGAQRPAFISFTFRLPSFVFRLFTSGLRRGGRGEVAFPLVGDVLDGAFHETVNDRLEVAGLAEDLKLFVG
jgi:Glycosyltransferase family 87